MGVSRLLVRRLEQDVADRFAFAAQFWGNAAVVVRAIEDQPDPIVEPQFGEFDTWTQASAFAAKLNEGLEIDPRTARQIITSSFLSTARVIQAALASRTSWDFFCLQADCQSTRLRFVLLELALALTYCHSASLVAYKNSRRAISNACAALRHAQNLMVHLDGDSMDLENLAATASELSAALHQLPFCIGQPTGN